MLTSSLILIAIAALVAGVVMYILRVDNSGTNRAPANEVVAKTTSFMPDVSKFLPMSPPDWLVQIFSKKLDYRRDGL